MPYSSSTTGGADGSRSAAATAAAGGGLSWPMTSVVIFAILSSTCCNAYPVVNASEVANDKNFSPDLILPGAADVQRVR